jgi:hypothetical protein
VSYPTVQGRAVEGLLYREAQVCLGTAFANSSYRFFLSGTSTPANVYQDGALASPFPTTGFVTSDAFGRFPAIYLDPSVIYRVQFFDNTNAQRWQSDPYVSQLSTVGTSALSAFGIQIAPTGEVVVLAPNTGGSGVTLILNSGSLGTAALQVSATLPGNSAIIVNNSATTGAQTATFAAANKPGTATSSPAGWLPITCDGVQYYTPIWHGNPFTPYVASPTALGEVINASSVNFGGSGLTTATGGTAVPSNWFSPATNNIGASYYINITKTSGLSGVNFSAAQGAWTNIGAGGLTITSNAQSQVTGTYQLSPSISGSPVVANGTITLANNNGVQSPTYNGATPLVLASNGTATLNGAATTNWFLPTTGGAGTGIWIKVTQTGGTSGYTFSAANGVYTQIAGGLTIGISGPAGSAFNVTGTYIIASDSGGVNQLGSGTITLAGGSNVQSPNWSGTTPLALIGDGSAAVGGFASSSWYSPNTPNVGSGYWIKITRTGGTSGVNFAAAQGSWTNITNSRLTIGITGYSGVVGTATVTGTYQISNSSGGMPVLGSGTVSLSISGLTVLHVYSAGTAGTETIPTGSSNVVIDNWGGTGGGSGGISGQAVGTGGASSGYNRSSYSTVGHTGQTMNRSASAAGSGGAANGGTGTAGTTSTISSGTFTITTMTANAGGGGDFNFGSTAGTASGGNVANTTGRGNAANVRPGGTPIAGVNASGNAGGNGGSVTGSAGLNGNVGVQAFFYT